jgi:hypothetical protein
LSAATPTNNKHIIWDTANTNFRAYADGYTAWVELSGLVQKKKKLR